MLLKSSLLQALYLYFFQLFFIGHILKASYQYPDAFYTVLVSITILYQELTQHYRCVMTRPGYSGTDAFLDLVTEEALGLAMSGKQLKTRDVLNNCYYTRSLKFYTCTTDFFHPDYKTLPLSFHHPI